jgi:hypothetical protein
MILVSVMGEVDGRTEKQRNNSAEQMVGAAMCRGVLLMAAKIGAKCPILHAEWDLLYPIGWGSHVPRGPIHGCQNWGQMSYPACQIGPAAFYKSQ